MKYAGKTAVIIPKIFCETFFVEGALVRLLGIRKAQK